VIYKANKVIEDTGNIKCKVIVGSETTKEFDIKYKAKCRKCPLKFSALRLDFPTT